MKQPAITHDIRDVETGDVLHLKAEEDHRHDWEGPREFDITVSRTHKTYNFGWVIHAEETIDGDRSFYLNDDWTITYNGERVHS